MHWRSSLGLLALLLVVLAIVAPMPQRGLEAKPAAAAPVMAPAPEPRGPDVFTGLITVEGKQVPLPDGDWHVVGRTTTRMDDRPVVSVAMVRVRGISVDAAVLVQTNPLDKEAGWGKASGCDRSDLYFARVRYSSDHDGSCAYAAYVVPSVRRDWIDPAWKEAVLATAGRGWRLPPRWVEAVYRISDPRDALQVHYLFDPGGTGRVPAETVKRLVAWTEASWYEVGSGFRNRLSDDATMPDWRDSPAGKGKVLQPLPDSEVSQVEHLGTKMVTYRLFGTMTDLSVNYLWLGSLPSAGGLAVVGAVASSALYFVHELVWSRFEQPTALIGDLPTIGMEGPEPS